MTARQPQSAQEARMLGYPEWQIEQMFPGDQAGGWDVTDGLLGDGPQQEAPVTGLLSEPEKPRGFWEGGEKFRGRDAIAGILAAISDVGAAQGSGRIQPGAIDALSSGRFDAMKMAREAQAAQAARVAALQDYERKKRIDGRYKDPDHLEDNAGNRWVFRNGAWTLDFIDDAPKVYFQDGAMVQPGNPYLGSSPGYTKSRPPQTSRVLGEDIPIPRLGQPTPEEARAELERRRRMRGY